MSKIYAGTDHLFRIQQKNLQEIMKFTTDLFFYNFSVSINTGFYDRSLTSVIDFP